MRIVVALLAMFMCLGTPSIATDFSVYKKSDFKLLTPPRLLKIKSSTGIDRTVCLAITIHTPTGQKGAAVSEPGPYKSCPNDPADYLADMKETDKRGINTFPAKFIGRDSERATIGTTSYYMELDPSALIFRTTDSTGHEIYEAVCVSANRAVSNKSDRLSIVFPRTNINDPIQDFSSKVECGGIEYAVRNEIKTFKPDFIGTPEQLSARTAHPQVIQSAVGFGVPVSSAHK
jgi:hypothetical protein